MNNVKRAKDYITQSLLYLMKKEKFENITITDISKKAGVNRITFYRNFNSKEEVLKCYLDSITDNFIKTSKILYTPDNFQSYIINLFIHLERYKDIGILLYKSNMVHFLKDEFDRIFLAKAKNSNEIYHYAFVSGGLYNLYYYWIKNDFKETPYELANIFNDFYISKGDSN